MRNSTLNQVMETKADFKSILLSIHEQFKKLIKKKLKTQIYFLNKYKQVNNEKILEFFLSLTTQN
jgi:hypothetical protein